MNSFFEHHKDSIRWQYRCFDRILLNGLIQPFQRPERVIGFFNTYRGAYRGLDCIGTGSQDCRQPDLKVPGRALVGWSWRGLDRRPAGMALEIACWPVCRSRR
jgi:hypothetical protein